MMGGMVEAREEDRSRNLEFESQSWRLGKFLRASSLRGEGTDKKNDPSLARQFVGRTCWIRRI